MGEANERINQILIREVAAMAESLEDKSGQVITTLRFHLVCENLLERIILAKLQRGDRIIKANLLFYKKLCLVDSFDIIDDSCIKALRKLNEIRNKCSHEADKQITESDIEQIGRPFGKDFIKEKVDHSGELEKYLIAVLMLIYKKLTIELLKLEHPELVKEMFLEDF